MPQVTLAPLAPALALDACAELYEHTAGLVGFLDIMTVVEVWEPGRRIYSLLLHKKKSCATSMLLEILYAIKKEGFVQQQKAELLLCSLHSYLFLVQFRLSGKSDGTFLFLLTGNSSFCFKHFLVVPSSEVSTTHAFF